MAVLILHGMTHFTSAHTHTHTHTNTNTNIVYGVQ